MVNGFEGTWEGGQFFFSQMGKMIGDGMYVIGFKSVFSKPTGSQEGFPDNLASGILQTKAPLFVLAGIGPELKGESGYGVNRLGLRQGCDMSGEACECFFPRGAGLAIGGNQCVIKIKQDGGRKVCWFLGQYFSSRC